MHKAALYLAYPDNLISVVAIGYQAPGSKNIFVPPPTKIAELEVKNRYKSAEKTKPEHLLCVTSVIFRSNKARSTNT